MFSFIPLEDAKAALATKKVAATADTPISHQDERFDLFIYIPKEYLFLVAPKITALLKDAFKKGVIGSLSVFDPKQIYSSSLSNVPYHFTLPANYKAKSSQELAELCQKIEAILQAAKVPNQQRKTALLAFDRVLSDYLICDTTDLKYFNRLNARLSTKTAVTINMPKFLKLTVNNDIFIEYNNTDYTRPNAIHEYKGEQRIVGYDPFKVHIYIPKKHFALVAPQITALLVEATENLVITAFKVMDHRLLDLYSNGGTLRDNGVPYTLYLHPGYDAANAQKVAELCQKIEAILHAAKIDNRGRETMLYRSECLLSDYLMFRAANTAANIKAKKLIYMDGQTMRVADELRVTGENSEYYRYFAVVLKPSVTAKVAVTPAATLSQHVAAGKSPVSAPAAKKDQPTPTPEKSAGLAATFK